MSQTTAETTGQEADRPTLLRRAQYVEVASLLHNTLEVGVSLIAGFATGSTALLSYGFDSVIEFGGTGSTLYRLHGEAKGVGGDDLNRRKRWAAGILGVSFALLVAFILYDSITKLVGQVKPGVSGWGIALMVLSLGVNPLLAWGKFHYGKKLDSKTLLLDANDTAICLYQTAAVLAGLLLNQWLGWWWADPVAALTLVPYAAWEAWESFQTFRQVGDGDNNKNNAGGEAAVKE